MNGIHDLGGMHGFGPADREEHEPVFHHEWEGRVPSLALLVSSSLRSPHRPYVVSST